MQHSNNENVRSIAVSVGASGVIFRKESNKYYALTALHVVAALDHIDKTEIKLPLWEIRTVKEIV